jgi:hypothetical protein
MGTQLSPEYWRARTEETRTLAEGMCLPEIKKSLIRIADDYEHLAKMAEEIQKQQHGKPVFSLYPRLSR